MPDLEIIFQIGLCRRMENSWYYFVMPILHVVYYSKAASKNDLSMLHDILAVARRRNREESLTGFLVFRDGYFLQLLEGPEAEVRRCLDRIKMDRRHSAMTTLADFISEERIMPEWDMGLVEPTKFAPDVAGLLDLFEMGRRGEPYQTKSSVLAVLRLFAAEARALAPQS